MALTRLRRVRLERGLKMYTVAGKVGVSESTLSRIETGRIKAEPKVLRRLARVLKATVEELTEPSRS